MWTQQRKERVGQTKRGALTRVQYQMESRSPMGSCSITQGTQPSPLGGPRGVGGGKEAQEDGAIYLRLMPTVVRQKPTQRCKAVILQLKFLQIIKR